MMFYSCYLQRTKLFDFICLLLVIICLFVACILVIVVRSIKQCHLNLFSTCRSELKWFLKLSFIQGAFQSFFFSSSVVISFVTFMTYVLTGEVLKAQTVFTCISLFNIMRVVMALQFPIAITLLNECRVSVKRMEVSNDNFISNLFYFK